MAAVKEMLHMKGILIVSETHNYCYWTMNINYMHTSEGRCHKNDIALMRAPFSNEIVDPNYAFI